ncbi:hypothetical protein IAU60_003106 [Kwoniella sp. DSM 27419]
MRSLITIALAAVAVLAAPPQLPFDVSLESPSSQPAKVNISMYVMSRCPDARMCEKVFQQVIETDGVLKKIDVDIGYIGQINKSEPLGVSCKHGPLECTGNAHQLCLYTHLPLKEFVAVVDCQNYYSSFPGDIGTLRSVKQCVKAVGIDWDDSGIGRCIEGKARLIPSGPETEGQEEETLGKEARKLLLANIRETQRRNVTTSCTIDIASTIVSGGTRRCVVDGGVWKGCDDGHTAQDFVRVIETEYEALNSKGA